MFLRSTDRLLPPSGIDCLFKDSAGLLVLGVESHSSESRSVKALQSIRRVLSLVHQLDQCAALSQWLVFNVLALIPSLSGNRCNAQDGGAFARSTLNTK